MVVDPNPYVALEQGYRPLTYLKPKVVPHYFYMTLRLSTLQYKCSDL